MAQNRSRFVLLCQQSLAFALVAAVAAPAASVVSLDIVTPVTPVTAPPGPQSAAADRSDGALPPGAGARSAVATGPVRATVRTVPLVGVSGVGLRALGRTGSSRGGLAMLSAPQPVDGLATVGVTWSKAAQVRDRAITVSVRTRRAGTWSRWTTMPYHEEEGPDPRSLEGRQAAPGTDPTYVGAVDDVQVKARTDSGAVPAGMTLSLVDPGDAAGARAETPAIDTARLAAVRVTGRPRIFSRHQWGADERMRDRRSLHYGEVHAGFVHHTVNANRYSPGQVPSIIRGIYAYHTQARGWSDVGYNFLVDRFGRIWEGRYGGVDRPVVGAHTLGYNDDAFAMSAIGNFDITRPPPALVRSFGRLFAWKLSLHGVRASSRRQWVGKRYLPAVQGHRDVGQTACPGRYLYAQIPSIRATAARYQRSFAPRARTTRVAGSARPVIVVRDRTTKKVWLVRTRPGGKVGRITATGTSLPNANLLLNAGDWNGDGRGDLIVRSGRTGRTYLYRGTGAGRFRTPVVMSTRHLARVRLLAAVGDLTGDGHPDLVGQPVGGAMRIYPGDGRTGFRPGYVAHSAINAFAQLGIGLYDSDGSPDSLLRRSDGTLVLYRGNGPGGLTGGTRVGSLGRGYDWLVAVGDITGDGRPDLVARTRVTHRTWLLPGSARGFVSHRLFRAGMGRFDLAG